jgi:hypothetical protein
MTAHPAVVNIFFAGRFAPTAPDNGRGVDRLFLRAYFNKLNMLCPIRTRARPQPLSACGPLPEQDAFGDKKTTPSSNHRKSDLNG